MKVKEISQSIHQFFGSTSFFNSQIIDAAFLGSFSGHYGWKETAFGDCDIWLFCDNINRQATWEYIRFFLESLQNHLNLEYPELTTVYEVAYGPYKPAIEKLDCEVLFLHITVDDMNSYGKHSDFTKLSWSKYSCYRNRHLLRELLTYYEPLTLDLQTAKFGIREGLTRLDAQSIDIIKYDFSKNRMCTFSYYLGDPVFSEYMLYIAMTNARNFFRALGNLSADVLPNDDFVKEFCLYIKSNSLMEILRLKKHVEKCGYGVITPQILFDATYAFLNKLSTAWEEHSIF